jgi:hypothetical protein
MICSYHISNKDKWVHADCTIGSSSMMNFIERHKWLFICDEFERTSKYNGLVCDEYDKTS